MEKSDVLDEIRRIVEDEWNANSRPVLLSNLPRTLERTTGADYKVALEDRTLKAFLQENSEKAGVQLVQDPVHHARVGAIPRDQEYVFLSPDTASATSTPPITAADVRIFGRVLDAMTIEEQRTATLPASFVARLLAAI